MDTAVALVEIYLRLNGYLTLSEWQIQTLSESGQWQTLTDVDILGLRFPGDIYLVDLHDPEQREAMRMTGELLTLVEDTVDVIVGEVKEGEAVFNPAVSHHQTLHTALHRLAWLYGEGDLEKIVEDLGAHGVCYTPARGGGTIRTRLVAFGRAPEVTLNTVPIGRILKRLTAIFETHDKVLRSMRFSNPAAATLNLLHKTGFRISRDS
ncbi:MAG: hypothetical protein ACE5F5_04855 [Acidimicrobiia bacterium]